MSLLSTLGAKPWLLVGGLAVAAATGSVVAVHPWTTNTPIVIHGAGTQVLGEKLTGNTAPAAGPTGKPGPASPPGPTGKPGPTGSPGPTSVPGPNGSFTINGNVTTGMEPGVTSQLMLTVTNSSKLAISVTALSATLNHVDQNPSAPAGTCTVTNSGVVIHPWTGSAFTVAKNSTMPAPGYIPIEIASSSNPSCEGATFWFDYAGTAGKA